MSFRTTLILLACLLVFGAVFYLTRSGVADDPQINSDGELLVPGGLIRVTVTHGNTRYELRRGETGWEQVAPLWFPLNSQAGEAWATAVRNLVPQRELSPGLEGTPGLVELSLSPPTAVVEFITDRGAFTLGLGDQTVSQSGYVRTDEGRVFAVPDTLHTLAFQSRLTDAYTRKLPMPPLSSLASMVIKRPKQPLTLDRLGTVWSLTSDQQRRIKPEMLEALDALFQGTPILAFADAPPREQEQGKTPDRRYGLDTPQAELEIQQAGGMSFTLEVGRASALSADTVFARLSRDGKAGPVMTLPAKAVSPLFQSWSDYRDRHVFETAADQVRSLRVERPEREDVAIEDSGHGFGFVQTEGVEPVADLPAADAVIDALLAWETEQFVADFQPQTSSVLALELAWGITQQTRVSLYRDGDGFIAKRRDEPDGMVLTAATVSMLLELP